MSLVINVYPTTFSSDFLFANAITLVDGDGNRLVEIEIETPDPLRKGIHEIHQAFRRLDLGLTVTDRNYMRIIIQ